MAATATRFTTVTPITHHTSMSAAGVPSAGAGAAGAAGPVEGAERPMEGLDMESIKDLMASAGPVVSTVLLQPDGTAKEVNVDMTPSKMALPEVLGGSVTLAGQWPSIDVVVVALRDQTSGAANTHKLQPPFHKAEFRGPLLLVRMDESSNPQPFTLKEYQAFQAETIEEWEVGDSDEELTADSGDEAVAGAGGAGAGAAGVDMEDDEEDEEWTAEADGEDDDDEVREALYDAMFSRVTTLFREQHGREPTEEELKDIFTRLNAQMAAAGMGGAGGDDEGEEAA